MSTTATAVKHLPILDIFESKRLRYKSITTNVEKNSPCFEAMERDMQGVDAVWIETSKWQVQLARKRKDLLTGT